MTEVLIRTLLASVLLIITNACATKKVAVLPLPPNPWDKVPFCYDSSGKAAVCTDKEVLLIQVSDSELWERINSFSIGHQDSLLIMLGLPWWERERENGLWKLWVFICCKNTANEVIKNQRFAEMFGTGCLFTEECREKVEHDPKWLEAKSELDSANNFPGLTREKIIKTISFLQTKEELPRRSSK